MRKRYFASKPKNIPKGYDSKLEYRLHEGPLADCQHHCHKDSRIKYSVPHQYEYDFLLGHADKLYVLEAKGRFRDSTEASKYNYVREHLDSWMESNEMPYKDVELVFIFENSKTAYPFAKKRKDGTKQDHGEWATKNNFRWLCEKRGDLEGVETGEDLIERIDERNS